MKNEIQRKRLAAFSMRKAIGQTRNLLYVEGPTITVPGGYKPKTVLKAVRSWTVDAYRKPTKKESDKNVKLADHDAVFVWQGFDQFGVRAALPVRDAFLIDNGRNEVWCITHVKPIETFDALYIVTCKPFFNFELSSSCETEASSGIGISASANFSVTDIIFIRPPVSQSSIDLGTVWQTVPFSVFGPPPALNGDVRTACISSVQAVGASCIEFELQRSVEPEGSKIWERVESGLAQINGRGYCRTVWSDEPPWIAPGDLLRYRVRARLVSGYARIFNPEFTIKAEMILQRTQGYITVSFTGADLISGPVSIGSLPGRYITQVITKIDGDFGCNLNVGTASTPDLYGNFEGIEDHIGFVYEHGNTEVVQISAAGTPNATAIGEITILFS